MKVADPYVYPGTVVLKNTLGIRDQARLNAAENEAVTLRISLGVPKGHFDLRHLRAIHRHLFQDIYDWAGEIRMVELAKDGHQFQFCRFIETGIADVHARLLDRDFFRGGTAEAFAQGAGEIIGDINYVHPFREGNGRTQLLYLEQLAEHAGHPVDLTTLDPARWIAASRSAHLGDYQPMANEIAQALLKS